MSIYEERLSRDLSRINDAVVVGTGGFAGLLNDAGLFDAVHPDLALEGVRIAQEMNA